MEGVVAFATCAVVALVVVLIMLALRGLVLVYQYERGVVFQLGKFVGVREPGLTFIIPVFQSMRKVDMRIKTADIPRQEVMTRDNIPMLVNAVVYFKVINPEDVIIKIESYVCSTPVHPGCATGCDRQQRDGFCAHRARANCREHQGNRGCGNHWLGCGC